MPVTRISAEVACSSKDGASRWIGMRLAVLTGPCSSIGSPMTFRMRPSVSGPTGTVIGAPVSIDFLAAHHAVGAVHGDAAHRALAQFLRHFQHQGAVVDLAGAARSG